MINSYHNLTLEQIEVEAYLNNNELALAAIAKVDEAVEEAVKDALNGNEYEFTTGDLVATVQYLSSNPEWVKTDVGYYLAGFHEDTHPNNHHIAIEREGQGSWRIVIQHDEYGEMTFTDRVTGNFKTAQEQAIRCAIKLLAKGKQLRIS